MENTFLVFFTNLLLRGLYFISDNLKYIVLALCIERWLASFTPLWCHCIISNEKAVVNFIFPICVWHVFFPDCFWQVWLLEHWDSWICYTLYLSCLWLGKTLESFTWSFSSNLKTDCLSNIFMLWYWAQYVCNSSYVFVWLLYTALHAVCLLTHCLLNDKFSCYPYTGGVSWYTTIVWALTCSPS